MQKQPSAALSLRTVIEEILIFLSFSKIKAYLLNVINTKELSYSFIDQYFPPLSVQYLFIKSTVNPFVDIILTFFSRSSCLVLISISFVLFEVILSVISLLSKSVFFTKSVISEISVLLAKFPYFNLAGTFSDVHLLTS